MEFEQKLTYILWTFVLCQLITANVASKENNVDESIFQTNVMVEMQALRSEMEIMRSEMEALRVENVKLKQDVDGFKPVISGIESNQLDNFVSFTAVISTDVSYAPGSAIIFDRVLRNYGDGYNAQTGIFTCVVSGYYLWFVNLYTSNDDDISAEIYIENQDIMPELLAPDSSYDNASTLGVSYCEAGSGVWVRVTEIGGSPHQSERFRYNTFSGVLLSITV